MPEISKRSLCIVKSLIKTVLQVVRRLDYIVLYKYYCVFFKRNPKQVLFLSDSRKELSGNFLPIYNAVKNEYTVRKHLYFPKEMHPKKKMCKDMAESSYIIVDDFYPIIYPISLRKGTRLIQVWHAMGAFKTVGFARKQNHDKYSMTHRNYTDAVCSSESIRKDYAKAFRMDIKNIYGIGIPRTDVFFDNDYIKKTKKGLYKKYPILKNKRVILFAPTFRGNNIHNAYYDYSQINFKQFESALSEEYVCIVKIHPFVKNKITEKLNPDFYLDLSKEREINDLLFVTDILITDYSSVIFEASLLNIKTIFFAYDLKEYIESRDFFYPYEEYTFGPVVSDMWSLIFAIQHEEIDIKRLEVFKKKFVSSCDGNSTRRFVECLLREK